MKTTCILRAAVCAGLLWLTGGVRAAEGRIIIEGTADRLVPIALSGFSGEVASTLKFDLEVAGFEIVGAEQAQYLVEGSRSGEVQGTVTDRVNRAVVLSRRYTGANARASAHAFADDIVKTLTGRQGIAQTKIAFKREAGKGSEICIADYDGQNGLAVTQDNTIVAAPCWVPGKRMLYYTSYKLGNPDIYSHDLGTGVRKVVARYSGLNTSAALSPDGRKVAMILSKSGSPDVFVADADGSNLKQLTTTREDESSPCWSPDGRTICFVSRASGRAALYTIPAGGGTMQKLRVAGVSNPTEPDWSPDGRSIVFTSLMGDFQVCVVAAGGGDAVVLTSGEDPSWAPNSRTVVFARRKAGRRALSLLDVPTKRVKDVVNNMGSSSQPSWAK